MTRKAAAFLGVTAVTTIVITTAVEGTSIEGTSGRDNSRDLAVDAVRDADDETRSGATVQRRDTKMVRLYFFNPQRPRPPSTPSSGEAGLHRAEYIAPASPRR